MIARTWLVLALLAAAPAAAGVPGCPASPLGAQKRCKTGCPCGNACISCSRTCRVGSGSAQPEPTSTAPARPDMPPTREVQPLLARPAEAAPSPTTQWFGSAANRFFFRAGCPVIPLLAVGDQVVLPDSVAATTAGFRRLVMPNC